MPIARRFSAVWLTALSSTSSGIANEWMSPFTGKEVLPASTSSFGQWDRTNDWPLLVNFASG